MTPAERALSEFPIERLTMAVDVTAPDLDAIATAAQFAARLGTVVDAILLEDINLSRLAALPIARQLSLTPPAAPAAVDAAQLESELRAMARQTETALSTAARQLGLAWSLRAVRGQLPGALTGALGAHDLLVVSAMSNPRAGPAGLPLLGIAQRIERSVLLLSGRTLPRHPVVVLQAGSQLVERALAAGLRLRTKGAQVLDVVLSSGDAEAGALTDAIRRQLASHGVAARLLRLRVDGGWSIAAAINTTGADIAVLAGDLSFLVADGPEEIMVRTSRPVMIVR